MLLQVFCLQFILLTTTVCALIGGKENWKNCTNGLVELNDGMMTSVNVTPQEDGKSLCVLCYRGVERTWLKMFVNPRITIQTEFSNIILEDLTIYYGRNVSDVKSQSESPVLFTLNSMLLLKGEHSFSPFNHSCIGLQSSKGYNVHFRVKNPELWYLAYIAIGLVIFFCAPTWSRNLVFHYTTGMTVCILASVLVLVFLLTRMMPQRLKVASYVVMVVSSSASLFMFQLVTRSLQQIIQERWQYALGYVLVAGLLSFAFIYRIGPITDGRTLNLICWLIQGLGVLFISQGTQIPEASAAIVLLVLMVYVCPKARPVWIIRLRNRLFPRRNRLLTEEEWQKQGEEETRKALEELRLYCRSPQCDSWTIVRRLKSPNVIRFADYMSGLSHVTDAEIDEHETFVPGLNSDEDNDGESDSDRESSTQQRQEYGRGNFRNGPIRTTDYPNSDESEIEDTDYSGHHR